MPAPSATANSGSRDTSGFSPVTSATSACTAGMRVPPPTSRALVIRRGGGANRSLTTPPTGAGATSPNGLAAHSRCTALPARLMGSHSRRSSGSTASSIAALVSTTSTAPPPTSTRPASPLPALPLSLPVVLVLAALVGAPSVTACDRLPLLELLPLESAGPVLDAMLLLLLLVLLSRLGPTAWLYRAGMMTVVLSAVDSATLAASATAMTAVGGGCSRLFTLSGFDW
mmetsp:Transcript_21056/g.63367  ORF Transcript_21056/g.63367 Transcript_21056/m.63367 type:complete len:228 (+) Transcript_21056:162-845(+)